MDVMDKIESICKGKKYIVKRIPKGLQAFKVNPLERGKGVGKEVLWARKEGRKITVVAKSKQLLQEIGCVDIHTIKTSGHYVGYVKNITLGISKEEL